MPSLRNTVSCLLELTVFCLDLISAIFFSYEFFCLFRALFIASELLFFKSDIFLSYFSLYAFLYLSFHSFWLSLSSLIALSYFCFNFVFVLFCTSLQRATIKSCVIAIDISYRFAPSTVSTVGFSVSITLNNSSGIISSCISGNSA